MPTEFLVDPDEPKTKIPASELSLEGLVDPDEVEGLIDPDNIPEAGSAIPSFVRAMPIIGPGFEGIERGLGAGIAKSSSAFWDTLSGAATRLSESPTERTVFTLTNPALSITSGLQKILGEKDISEVGPSMMASFAKLMKEDADKGLVGAPEPRNTAEKFVSAGTQAGLGVAQIAALSTLTKNPAVAMGTLGAAESYAQREDTLGIAKGAASGALLGGIFHGTQYLPKLLSLGSNALIFGGMTAQGRIAERGGVEMLTPEDEEDIIIDTLVGAFLAIPGRNPSFADFRNSFKRKGFTESEIARAEEKVNDIVGTPEARQNLEAAIAKMNEEIATSGISTVSPKTKVSTSEIYLPNREASAGGYIKKPATYIRFGRTPESGKSKNNITGESEPGVSVYKAWYDPRTKKYVIEQQAVDISTQDNLSSQAEAGKKKIFEVSGKELRDVGADSESLLAPGSTKIVKEIKLDDIVLMSDPWLTLSGKELDKNNIPNWELPDIVEPKQLPLKLGTTLRDRAAARQAEKAAVAADAEQQKAQVEKELRDIQAQIPLDFPATEAAPERRLPENEALRKKFSEDLIARAKNQNKELLKEVEDLIRQEIAEKAKKEELTSRRPPETIAEIEKLPFPEKVGVLGQEAPSDIRTGHQRYRAISDMLSTSGASTPIPVIDANRHLFTGSERDSLVKFFTETSIEKKNITVADVAKEVGIKNLVGYDKKDVGIELFKIRPIKEIESDLIRIENSIDKQMKKIEATRDESAFAIERTILDGLEKQEAALIKERLEILKKDISKADPTLDIEKALSKELEMFEIPEEARAVVDGRLNPITGEMTVEPQVVQEKIANVQAQPKAFADIRKDMLAAYRFKASNEVVYGKTHGELSGDIISGPHDRSQGIELGWIDPKDGQFIAESVLKGGPVENVRVTEKLNVNFVAKVLSKIRDERGSISGEPLPFEIPKDQLENVKKLRENFPALRRAAKQAKLSVEEYLHSKGFSQESIDLYQQLSLLDIRTSELIPKATKWQKGYAHKLAAELNVDHRNIAESIGISRDKSMAVYSFDEATKLLSVLEHLRDKKEGMPYTEENIKQRLDAEDVGSYKDILRSDASLSTKVQDAAWRTSRQFLSPDIVLPRNPVGAEIYRLADMQDVRKKQHLEYIMSKTGLGVETIEKTIKKGTESARKVGLALENRIKPEELTANEKKAVDTFRLVYKHTLDMFVKSRVQDPAREAIVREVAKRVKYRTNEDAEYTQGLIASYKDRYNLNKREMEALELLRMEIKYYMPHVFDKQFISTLIKQRLEAMKKSGSSSKQKIAEYEDTLTKLEGGQLVTYNAIPKSIMFDYYKARHGLPGYQVDANVAFNVYIRGWLRKMYDEPFLRRAADLYTELPMEMKPYAKRFIYDYMGWRERTSVANFIKSYEWVRTLGLAGRSAITNTTQILNTLSGAIANPAASYAGFKRAATKKGIDEFKFTGMQREIPTVLFSGEELPFASKLEKVRAVSGILFNAVEFGLRNHAYHTGLEMAKKQGLKGEDAFWYAVDFTHQTQFRYGRVGMPMAMRGWGGVVTQFSSYTVKQGELLYKWMKEPGGWAKVATFIALSAGAKYAADELLGADLSSALGVGTKFGELYESLEGVTKGEWEDAVRHWNLAWAGGSGILPNNFPLITGPALSLLKAVGSTEDGKWMKVASELEPIQGQRLKEFIYALKHEKSGRYPVFKYTNPEMLSGSPERLKYTLNLKDTIMRFLGPKPSAETAEQLRELSARLTEKEIKVILTRLNRALATGDTATVERLLSQYPGVVKDAKVHAGATTVIKNLNLTDEQRRLIKESNSRTRGSRRVYLENR